MTVNLAESVLATILSFFVSFKSVPGFFPGKREKRNGVDSIV